MNYPYDDFGKLIDRSLQITKVYRSFKQNEMAVNVNIILCSLKFTITSQEQQARKSEELFIIMLYMIIGQLTGIYVNPAYCDHSLRLPGSLLDFNDLNVRVLC